MKMDGEQTNPSSTRTKWQRMVKAGRGRTWPPCSAATAAGAGSAATGEYSYPHTTALVVHGLQLAQANGVALPPNMLERGVTWLQAVPEYRSSQLQLWDQTKTDGKPQADALDAFVYMVLADAKAGKHHHARLPLPRPQRPARLCQVHVRAGAATPSATRRSATCCGRTSSSTWCRMRRTRPPI